MLDCNKRQKVVSRTQSGSLTTFRCLNNECGLNGQQVDEGNCERCPVRVVQSVRPCRDLPRPPKKTSAGPPVSTQEMIDVTDEEVIKMIEEAGMDAKDIDKVQVIESGELPPDYPPMSMQLWTYKEALIRWHKAGRPTRTQEEVEELHKICSACDWYDPEKTRCKGCGCKVTVGAVAIFNKLKMKTEVCPKGKF